MISLVACSLIFDLCSVPVKKTPCILLMFNNWTKDIGPETHSRNSFFSASHMKRNLWSLWLVAAWKIDEAHSNLEALYSSHSDHGHIDDRTLSSLCTYLISQIFTHRLKHFLYRNNRERISPKSIGMKQVLKIQPKYVLEHKELSNNI